MSNFRTESPQDYSGQPEVAAVLAATANPAVQVSPGVAPLVESTAVGQQVGLALAVAASSLRLLAVSAADWGLQHFELPLGRLAAVRGPSLSGHRSGEPSQHQPPRPASPGSPRRDPSGPASSYLVQIHFEVLA